MNELRKLFRHDAWANRRLLRGLTEIKQLDPEVRRLFAHIQTGLKVWIRRIQGQDTRSMAIWPDLTLEECAVLIEENERACEELLRGATEAILERTVSYTNQHGLSYETPVGDILLQAATHGGYHRGQIARLLRQSGEEPINTDYITYVREEAGQPWKP
jgi:uncharacterized damage-inducible protein DinB